MGHGGLKETALCPAILVVKALHVDMTATALTIVRVPISLGPFEAYDLLAVNYTFDGTISANEDAEVQVALSVLPLENEARTGLTDTVFVASPHLFAHSRFHLRAGTTVGVNNSAMVDRVVFPIPLCLVHPVSVWVNKIDSASPASVHVSVELWLVKKSLGASVITQLLKVYQDVKSAFKQA